MTNTFSYLYSLFDPNGKLTAIDLRSVNSGLGKIAKYVDFLKQGNSYDKIELKTVFEFMNQCPY